MKDLFQQYGRHLRHENVHNSTAPYAVSPYELADMFLVESAEAYFNKLNDKYIIPVLKQYKQEYKNIGNGNDVYKEYRNGYYESNLGLDSYHEGFKKTHQLLPGEDKLFKRLLAMEDYLGLVEEQAKKDYRNEEFKPPKGLLENMQQMNGLFPRPLIDISDLVSNSSDTTSTDSSNSSNTTSSNTTNTNTSDNTNTNTSDNTSTDTSDNTSTDTSDNTSTDTSDNTSTDTSDNTSTDTSDNTSTDSSDNTSTDTSDNTSTDSSDNTSTDTSDNSNNNLSNNRFPDRYKSLKDKQAEALRKKNKVTNNVIGPELTTDIADNTKKSSTSEVPPIQSVENPSITSDSKSIDSSSITNNSKSVDAKDRTSDTSTISESDNTSSAEPEIVKEDLDNTDSETKLSVGSEGSSESSVASTIKGRVPPKSSEDSRKNVQAMLDDIVQDVDESINSAGYGKQLEEGTREPDVNNSWAITKFAKQALGSFYTGAGMTVEGLGLIFTNRFWEHVFGDPLKKKSFTRDIDKEYNSVTTFGKNIQDYGQKMISDNHMEYKRSHPLYHVQSILTSVPQLVGQMLPVVGLSKFGKEIGGKRTAAALATGYAIHGGIVESMQTAESEAHNNLRNNILTLRAKGIKDLAEKRKEYENSGQEDWLENFNTYKETYLKDLAKSIDDEDKIAAIGYYKDFNTQLIPVIATTFISNYLILNGANSLTTSFKNLKFGGGISDLSESAGGYLLRRMPIRRAWQAVAAYGLVNGFAEGSEEWFQNASSVVAHHVARKEYIDNANRMNDPITLSTLKDLSQAFSGNINDISIWDGQALDNFIGGFYGGLFLGGLTNINTRQIPKHEQLAQVERAMAKHIIFSDRYKETVTGIDVHEKRIFLLKKLRASASPERATEIDNEISMRQASVSGLRQTQALLRINNIMQTAAELGRKPDLSIAVEINTQKKKRDALQLLDRYHNKDEQVLEKEYTNAQKQFEGTLFIKDKKTGKLSEEFSMSSEQVAMEVGRINKEIALMETAAAEYKSAQKQYTKDSRQAFKIAVKKMLIDKYVDEINALKSGDPVEQRSTGAVSDMVDEELSGEFKDTEEGVDKHVTIPQDTRSKDKLLESLEEGLAKHKEEFAKMTSKSALKEAIAATRHDVIMSQNAMKKKLEDKKKTKQQRKDALKDAVARSEAYLRGEEIVPTPEKVTKTGKDGKPLPIDEELNNRLQQQTQAIVGVSQYSSQPLELHTNKESKEVDDAGNYDADLVMDKNGSVEDFEARMPIDLYKQLLIIQQLSAVFDTKTSVLRFRYKNGTYTDSDALALSNMFVSLFEGMKEAGANYAFQEFVRNMLLMSNKYGRTFAYFEQAMKNSDILDTMLAAYNKVFGYVATTEGVEIDERLMAINLWNQGEAAYKQHAQDIESRAKIEAGIDIVMDWDPKSGITREVMDVFMDMYKYINENHSYTDEHNKLLTLLRLKLGTKEYEKDVDGKDLIEKLSQYLQSVLNGNNVSEDVKTWLSEGTNAADVQEFIKLLQTVFNNGDKKNITEVYLSTNADGVPSQTTEANAQIKIIRSEEGGKISYQVYIKNDNGGWDYQPDMEVKNDDGKLSLAKTDRVVVKKEAPAPLSVTRVTEMDLSIQPTFDGQNQAAAKIDLDAYYNVQALINDGWSLGFEFAAADEHIVFDRDDNNNPMFWDEHHGNDKYNGYDNAPIYVVVRKDGQVRRLGFLPRSGHNIETLRKDLMSNKERVSEVKVSVNDIQTSSSHEGIVGEGVNIQLVMDLMGKDGENTAANKLQPFTFVVNGEEYDSRFGTFLPVKKTLKFKDGTWVVETDGNSSAKHNGVQTLPGVVLMQHNDEDNIQFLLNNMVTNRGFPRLMKKLVRYLLVVNNKELSSADVLTTEEIQGLRKRQTPKQKLMSDKEFVGDMFLKLASKVNGVFVGSSGSIISDGIKNKEYLNKVRDIKNRTKEDEGQEIDFESIKFLDYIEKNGSGIYVQTESVKDENGKSVQVVVGVKVFKKGKEVVNGENPATAHLVTNREVTGKVYTYSISEYGVQAQLHLFDRFDKMYSSIHLQDMAGILNGTDVFHNSLPEIVDGKVVWLPYMGQVLKSRTYMNMAHRVDGAIQRVSADTNGPIDVEEVLLAPMSISIGLEYPRDAVGVPPPPTPNDPPPKPPVPESDNKNKDIENKYKDLRTKIDELVLAIDAILPSVPKKDRDKIWKLFNDADKLRDAVNFDREFTSEDYDKHLKSLESLTARFMETGADDVVIVDTEQMVKIRKKQSELRDEYNKLQEKIAEKDALYAERGGDIPHTGEVLFGASISEGGVIYDIHNKVRKGDSLYPLRIEIDPNDSNKGYVTIDPEGYGKIIINNNYLKDGMKIIQSSGDDPDARVVVRLKGVVEKQTDGGWKFIDKAIITIKPPEYKYDPNEYQKERSEEIQEDIAKLEEKYKVLYRVEADKLKKPPEDPPAQPPTTPPPSVKPVAEKNNSLQKEPSAEPQQPITEAGEDSKKPVEDPQQEAVTQSEEGAEQQPVETPVVSEEAEAEMATPSPPPQVQQPQVSQEKPVAADATHVNDLQALAHKLLTDGGTKENSQLKNIAMELAAGQLSQTRANQISTQLARISESVSTQKEAVPKSIPTQRDGSIADLFDPQRREHNERFRGKLTAAEVDQLSAAVGTIMAQNVANPLTYDDVVKLLDKRLAEMAEMSMTEAEAKIYVPILQSLTTSGDMRSHFLRVVALAHADAMRNFSVIADEGMQRSYMFDVNSEYNSHVGGVAIALRAMMASVPMNDKGFLGYPSYYRFNTIFNKLKMLATTFTSGTMTTKQIVDAIKNIPDLDAFMNLMKNSYVEKRDAKGNAVIYVSDGEQGKLFSALMQFMRSQRESGLSYVTSKGGTVKKSYSNWQRLQDKWSGDAAQRPMVIRKRIEDATDLDYESYRYSYNPELLKDAVSRLSSAFVKKSVDSRMRAIFSRRSDINYSDVADMLFKDWGISVSVAALEKHVKTSKKDQDIVSAIINFGSRALRGETDVDGNIVIAYLRADQSFHIASVSPQIKHIEAIMADRGEVEKVTTVVSNDGKTSFFQGVSTILDTRMAEFNNMNERDRRVKFPHTNVFGAINVSRLPKNFGTRMVRSRLTGTQLFDVLKKFFSYKKEDFSVSPYYDHKGNKVYYNTHMVQVMLPVAADSQSVSFAEMSVANFWDALNLEEHVYGDYQKNRRPRLGYKGLIDVIGATAILPEVIRMLSHGGTKVGAGNLFLEFHKLNDVKVTINGEKVLAVQYIKELAAKDPNYLSHSNELSELLPQLAEELADEMARQAFNMQSESFKKSARKIFGKDLITFKKIADVANQMFVEDKKSRHKVKRTFHKNVGQVRELVKSVEMIYAMGYTSLATNNIVYGDITNFDGGKISRNISEDLTLPPGSKFTSLSHMVSQLHSRNLLKRNKQQSSASYKNWVAVEGVTEHIDYITIQDARRNNPVIHEYFRVKHPEIYGEHGDFFKVLDTVRDKAALLSATTAAQVKALLNTYHGPVLEDSALLSQFIKTWLEAAKSNTALYQAMAAANHYLAGVDSSDALEFMSHKEYLYQMVAMQKITVARMRELSEKLDKHLSGQHVIFTEQDRKDLSVQMHKYVYSGVDDAGNNHYIKSAAYPLIPIHWQKDSEQWRMMGMMARQEQASGNFVRVVHSSAYKVGSRGATDFYGTSGDVEGIKVSTLSRRGHGYQQNLAGTPNKGMENLPIQFMIHLFGEGMSEHAGDSKAKVSNLINKLSQVNREAFFSTTGMRVDDSGKAYIHDKKAFLKWMQARLRSYVGEGEFSADYIQGVLDELANVSSDVSLDSFTLWQGAVGRRLFSSLRSFIVSELMSVEGLRSSYPIASMDMSGAVGVIRNSGGHTYGIYVPDDMILDIHGNKIEMSDDEVRAWMDSHNDGKGVAGTRIPNAGYPSMYGLPIVGVIRNSKAVILPDGYNLIDGSDMDGDKTHIMFRGYMRGDAVSTVIGATPIQNSGELTIVSDKHVKEAMKVYEDAQAKGFIAEQNGEEYMVVTIPENQQTKYHIIGNMGDGTISVRVPVKEYLAGVNRLQKMQIYNDIMLEAMNVLTSQEGKVRGLTIHKAFDGDSDPLRYNAATSHVQNQDIMNLGKRGIEIFDNFLKASSAIEATQPLQVGVVAWSEPMRFKGPVGDIEFSNVTNLNKVKREYLISVQQQSLDDLKDPKLAGLGFTVDNMSLAATLFMFSTEEVANETEARELMNKILEALNSNHMKSSATDVNAIRKLQGAVQWVARAISLSSGKLKTKTWIDMVSLADDLDKAPAGTAEAIAADNILWGLYENMPLIGGVLNNFNILSHFVNGVKALSSTSMSKEVLTYSSYQLSTYLLQRWLQKTLGNDFSKVYANVRGRDLPIYQIVKNVSGKVLFRQRNALYMNFFDAIYIDPVSGFLQYMRTGSKDKQVAESIAAMWESRKDLVYPNEAGYEGYTFEDLFKDLLYHTLLTDPANEKMFLSILPAEFLKEMGYTQYMEEHNKNRDALKDGGTPSYKEFFELYIRNNFETMNVGYMKGTFMDLKKGGLKVVGKDTKMLGDREVVTAIYVSGYKHMAGFTVSVFDGDTPKGAAYIYAGKHSDGTHKYELRSLLGTKMTKEYLGISGQGQRFSYVSDEEMFELAQISEQPKSDNVQERIDYLAEAAGVEMSEGVPVYGDKVQKGKTRSEGGVLYVKAGVKTYADKVALSQALLLHYIDKVTSPHLNEQHRVHSPRDADKRLLLLVDAAGGEPLGPWLLAQINGHTDHRKLALDYLGLTDFYAKDKQQESAEHVEVLAEDTNSDANDGTQNAPIPLRETSSPIDSEELGSFDEVIDDNVPAVEESVEDDGELGGWDDNTPPDKGHGCH